MIIETTENVDKLVLKHFSQEENGYFSNAAMSFIDDKGAVMLHKGNMMCHYFLNELGNCRNAKGIYFSLWYYNKRGHDKNKVNRYFDFILDKEVSPWRPVLEHSRIIRDDKGNYKAIYITNIENMSIQYLASFAVATRQPGELGNRFDTFNYLIDEKKLTPLQSLYVLSHFYRSNTVWVMGLSHHFPFNPYGPNSFSKLKNANPTTDPELIFKSDKGYQPLNAIWFDSNDAKIFHIMNKKPVKYEGSFKKYFESIGRVGDKFILNISGTGCLNLGWIEKEIEKGDIFA